MALPTQKTTAAVGASFGNDAALPILVHSKIYIMGLLNQKGKDADKKKGVPKAGTQGSKFIASKSTKAAGGPKKPMTGGSQRGS